MFQNAKMASFTFVLLASFTFVFGFIYVCPFGWGQSNGSLRKRNPVVVALSVSPWAETRRSRFEMLMRMFTVQGRVWTQAPLAGAQRSLARGSPRSVARLTRARGADRTELVQADAKGTRWGGRGLAPGQGARFS